MAKILNKQTLLKSNVENEAVCRIASYGESQRDSIKANGSKVVASGTVAMGSMTFVGTEAHVKNQDAIKGFLEKRALNAAQFPQTDYYALTELVYLNLARRILQQADLTGFMDEIIVNENFTEFVGFKDFAKIDAIFDTFKGTGDEVDLISLQTGDKTTVQLELNGVGFRDTLLNTLYNMELSYMERVLQAVAEGYVAKKNDLCVGPILATSYDASMSISADATGDTPEEKLYLTLNDAIEKLGECQDPLTGDLIDTSNLALLVNPSEQRKINRAINGVINNNAQQVNRVALTEISTIVPYGSKRLVMGEKVANYAGVTKGEAYMFIPKAHRYNLVKRSLTTQTSPGDAISLGKEDKAWYFVGGRYDDLFFGSSNATVKAACAAAFDDSGEEYGYIVKIELP